MSGGRTRRKAAAAVAASQPAKQPTKKSAPKMSKKTPKRKQPDRPARQPPYTSALLLTVREAANLLRISERKMYYLLAREIIVPIKIDQSTRIKRSVIDNYIATLELEQVSA